MNAKLTPRMNTEVIEFAKAYFRKTGQSISGLVASYFQGIKALDGGKEQKAKGDVLHPIVRSLRGSLKGARAKEFWAAPRGRYGRSAKAK